ncbi:MAG: hypothetical protein HOO91_01995 [Bacteroidales bacterium]|nr:hypothetical protein [Bacteroidales bacterium]
MKTIDIEQFGTTELTLEDKKNINGGFVLAIIGLMAAFGMGYFLGRWMGGDPVTTE